MSASAITALVLAGGRATRMGGVDKRALVVDGRTIFERQCAVLAPRVAEIVVSTTASVPGYRSVRDAIEGVGPLGGIAAGLATVTTPWLLVVAGDMPYLSPAVIDALISRATDEVDAVGIRIDGLPEPLLCVLRVAAARDVVQRRLEAKRYKASTLLTDGELRVAWLDEVELRILDPELRSIANINAPADLARR